MLSCLPAITDGNAVVRQRVDEALVTQRAPLLTEIVRQGIQEGVFTTPFPDQAGEVIMALLQSMGDTLARPLFSSAEQTISRGAAYRSPAARRSTEHDQQRRVETIMAAHAAYMEAIERVLGAPPSSLYRADVEAVMVWVAAPQPARRG